MLPRPPSFRPVLLLTALLLALPTALAALEIRGTVTDAQGRAIPEAAVVFEAAREGLSLRDLRMGRGRTQIVRAVSDRRGFYQITWDWDRFFNRFEVRVEMPGPQEDSAPAVLARRELRGLRAAGEPIVANLVVDDAERLYRSRDFLSRLDTAAERRIYEQYGRPDRVDRSTRGDDLPGEATWWYFGDGRAFFFAAGELVEERRFTPIRPF